MNETQKHLRSLAISETGFLFDPVTGNTYTLNGTGCELLKMLRDGAEVSDLPARLSAAYDVAEADAERDCEAFLRLLREYRLIES